MHCAVRAIILVSPLAGFLTNFRLHPLFIIRDAPANETQLAWRERTETIVREQRRDVLMVNLDVVNRFGRRRGRAPYGRGQLVACVSRDRSRDTRRGQRSPIHRSTTSSHSGLGVACWIRAAVPGPETCRPEQQNLEGSWNRRRS